MDVWGLNLVQMEQLQLFTGCVSRFGSLILYLTAPQ